MRFVGHLKSELVVCDRLHPSDCCLLAFMPLCSPLPHLSGLAHVANRTWQKSLYVTSKIRSWILSPSHSYFLLNHLLWGKCHIVPYCEQPFWQAHVMRNWNFLPTAMLLILEGDPLAQSSFQMTPALADVLIATSCKAPC